MAASTKPVDNKATQVTEALCTSNATEPGSDSLSTRTSGETVCSDDSKRDAVPRMRYCERQIDRNLDEFLNNYSEDTRVGILFCPARTGKTRAVCQAAERNAFDLRRFDNREFRDLLAKMSVNAGAGTYVEFRDEMARAFNRDHLNVGPNAKVLIHLDEAQVHLNGIEKLRESVFDFSSPPDAVRLAALIHCIRLMCNDRVRLVVSGTAVNAGPIVQLGSEDKFTMLTILPTDVAYVQKVLEDQVPPVQVTGQQAEELCGHIGQLHCVYETSLGRNGRVDLDAAFNLWYDQSHRRQRWSWSLHDTLRAAYLIHQLPVPPQNERFVLLDPHDARPPAIIGKLVNLGEWLTVQWVYNEFKLLWPTPWQRRALDKHFAQATRAVCEAFLVQGAAKCTDEGKQKGFVFQCMFVLELCRFNRTPLWAAIEEVPVQFKKIERFAEDKDWQHRVLYVVHESSKKKAGDIVWRAEDGSVVCLELKCGSDEYIKRTSRQYSTKLSSAAKSCHKNIRHVFVSCSRVEKLEFTGRAKLLNGACEVEGLHYHLHPAGATDVEGFGDSITRSASDSAVVVHATAAGLNLATPAAKRSRPEDHSAPCHVLVALGDGATLATDVSVSLRARALPHTVDGLRRALLGADAADLELAKMTVYAPGEDHPCIQVFDPLAATTQAAPYRVCLPGAPPPRPQADTAAAD